VLAVAAILVAISAYGGTLGLATGALSLGETLNDRLPFHSPVIGGLALGVIVGIPFTVLAVWAWRGDPRTGTGSLVIGLVLVGWLLVELGFIRELSFFHPLYGLIGVAFVIAGWTIRSKGDLRARS
jgi:hypothetical protein